MWEWIKELQPEFLIIFAAFVIIILMNIGIWLKTTRTLSLIGKRALTIKEDLVIREDKKVIDILISNTTFISVKVAAIGYIYQKNLLPISEDVTEISPRDSEKVSVEIDGLRIYLIDEKRKVKKLKLYVEDTLGRRSIQKAKDTYRVLKKMIKKEKHAEKKAAKKRRYETGKYNFFERLGLVLKFIFSPITKLNYLIKTSVNKRLKERETSVIIKKKEREHKEFLKSIAEEDRREKEIQDVEKRIEKEQEEIKKIQENKRKQEEIKQQNLDKKLKKIEKEKAELAKKDSEQEEVKATEKAEESDEDHTEKIEEKAETSENTNVEKEKIEEKKPVKKTTKKNTETKK